MLFKMVLVPDLGLTDAEFGVLIEKSFDSILALFEYLSEEGVYRSRITLLIKKRSKDLHTAYVV